MTEAIFTWQKIIDELSKVLSKEVLQDFFYELKPLDLKDNQLILGTQSIFEKEWLEKRYEKTLSDASFNALGKRLVFVGKILSPDEISEIPYANYKPEDFHKEMPKDDFYGQNIALNPRYTFDTFVVGNSNRMTHAASLAVANEPGQAYNPLFIYGGVGLGKTHLMHAIGHSIVKHNQNAKVVYVSSETFTNELIDSIQYNRNLYFRNKYRNVDVLLIDDIQFIAGKESTQEEFFHTFNALHELNKQIIISSDRHPKAITTLEERLRSRFEWGLTTDIQPPDYETRIAIVERKARTLNVEVPKEVIQLIAENIHTNIRELEGALTRVTAYAQITQNAITVELAAIALQDQFSMNRLKPLSAEEIMAKVAHYFNIKVEDMVSKKRSQNVVAPRQIAMYLCRTLTDHSLPKIGELFQRDHSTVIHSCEKIEKDMLIDPNLAKKITDLKEELKK